MALKLDRNFYEIDKWPAICQKFSQLTVLFQCISHETYNQSKFYTSKSLINPFVKILSHQTFVSYGNYRMVYITTDVAN